ncbi:hypothetical protein [Roseiconus lacunae]|uniref:Uncharacterized protein n=1 Tax=Roseiconus lacunae TaxID=2605694 RepID=A0ABT7PPD8_9BACT|nr:hypothetical protein [Roseiconus lacunae]MDM4018203.1 hypothetical protein [Roseiconus lacunae]
MRILINDSRSFQRMISAYQAVARAVLHCLHDEGSQISAIVLHEFDDDHSFHPICEIRLRPNSGLRFPDLWAYFVDAVPFSEDLILHSCRFISSCLIGAAAEERLSREIGINREMGWLDTLLERTTFLKPVLFEQKWHPSQVQSDIDKAFVTARCFLGEHDDGFALDHIDFCAAEVDRVVGDEPVWQLITEVAEELGEQQTISGDVVLKKSADLTFDPRFGPWNE